MSANVKRRLRVSGRLSLWVDSRCRRQLKPQHIGAMSTRSNNIRSTSFSLGDLLILPSIYFGSFSNLNPLSILTAP